MKKSKRNVYTPAERVRLDARVGKISGSVHGLAPGYVHCNLVIIRQALAYDFLLYCQRNSKACPLLEVTDPGNPEPKRIAPGADLRTDLPRYAVYEKGVRQKDLTDISALWQDDFVAFLIGSGITFDQALERAGVPTHQFRWVLRTKMPTEPAGCFQGDLIVTMRWLNPKQVITAIQVSSRFPWNHGAPLHIGDPAAIQADLKHPLYGPPVNAVPAEFVPVFWACGVTPQAAAEAAKIDMITHAPAHGFISDLKADEICIP